MSPGARWECWRKELRAGGGLDLSRLTGRFIVHMSITGDLCGTKCSNAKLKERRCIQDTSASQGFSYRLCVDCQPSGPTRCRSANQRCWMSKSSTSILHRGALRCTRPRKPRQPASNGSQLAGTLHRPEQTFRLQAGHRVPMSRRRCHRGAPSASKEIQLQRGGVPVKGRDSIY